MNDEIHQRALAAAMRLSLTCACGTLAIVPACSPKPAAAPAAPTTSATASPSVAEPAPDGATVTASTKYGRPRVDPLPETMTCDERLANALPQSGDIAGTREVARRTEAVVSCCVDVVKTKDWGHAHFGDCCGIVHGQIPDAEIPQACSPWGPAVPPSMTWSPGRGIA